uniref:Cellular communication network factor 5 n=1 Tax=Ficedula albicollis TaxID=59894 RepID=A0A803W6I8_FICAL
MRLQLEKQLLFLSLLCVLSKVCAQLCRRPCYCPWVPPRCPRASPLVLDGCGCCKVCARRLGEPCDFLHVCDQSQGLVCDYSSASAGTGGTCNFEDDEEGCEVNGRVYRDGEVFQPSCKIQCHCLDGGFNCIPLCQEDVRLPTPDCPHPRRVEIPGKCCPEWVCAAQDQHLLRDARAGKMQAAPGRGRPRQSLGMAPSPQAVEHQQETPRTKETPFSVPAAPQGTARHLFQPSFPPSCRFLQPPGHCPRCCDSPARSGARSGAPARPPAGWALPPACPTRTATAGWRARGGSACSDPARPCRQRSQR